MSSILIDRDFAGDGLWLSDKFTQAQMWLDILLRANIKIGTYRRGKHFVTVPVGSLVLVTRSTAKRWGCEEKDVNRVLHILAVVGFIKLKEHKGLSIVDVVNFQNYLPEGNNECC